MLPNYDTYKPPGFHTVNAYLFAEDPRTLIQFLKNAFLAIEINCTLHPRTGEIANCILKIGDSCFMISQAQQQYRNMKTSFYLFVENVDETHTRALLYGGISEFEPADMPYHDRQSGIIDPSGNYWWISKRLIQQGY